MNLETKKSSVTPGTLSDAILIKETPIFLNFETQISKLGRPFKLSGTRKNLQMPEKWINKVTHWHWVHSFKYLDEQGGFFEIEIDYNNNFVKLEKN